MIATKIRENIYWVGAIDWNLRYFHGYATSRGSTYNAYIVFDEKITLIDNVKDGFQEELMERIKSIVDPSKIEVIISNHGEPDHSGALPEILKYAKNATIYSSGPVGANILKAYYGKDLNVIPVKTGDKISTGKYTYSFYQIPFVHWPDNMVSYLEEEKILFSNDAYGQHYATSNRYDYDTDLHVSLFEAKKYYANIVLPYSPKAISAIESVNKLDIEMIAPSHGIIWTKHIKEIKDLYYKMANRILDDKAVIIYDTMYDSTKKIAYAIAQAFDDSKISYELIDINHTASSDIITEVMLSKYIAIGSPTINNVMLPTIAGFLNYLKGLNPTGLKYIAFGSFGWSGQSIGYIEDVFKELKYEKLVDNIRLNYVPNEQQLTDVKNKIIEALKKD